MDEQVKQEMARKVFEALCRYMDQCDLKYDKDQQELQIRTGFSGEDIPVDIRIHIDADRKLIKIFSPLPFKMEEDKRVDGAIAINAINYRLVDGCFDYDLTDGMIVFRAAAYYCNAAVEDELFHYLIGVTVSSVDAYNDKLLMLNKSMWTIEDFLKSTMSND